MPVYEFQCQDCQSAFRERRPFDQAGVRAICPVCHSEHTKKLLNAVAVIGGASQTERQRAGSIPLDDMSPGSGCGCGACSCGS